MVLGIASDHAGYEYKEAIKEHLSSKGHEMIDFGTDSLDSTDYADFIHPLGNEIDKGNIKAGIAVCGSGQGVCMTANKHPKVRAALAWNKEVAEVTRQHNDANVLCLPARFISTEQATEIVDTFLATTFEGGRHQRRINKIPLKDE